MRPEYELTPRGRSLAPRARRLLAAATRGGQAELLGKKWSLPVLAALAGGADRFGAIGAVLDAPAPRALALALRELEDAGLVARRVEDGHPPAVRYGFGGAAGLRRALRELLAALGRA